MKKIDKIISKDRVSVFAVDKDTSNEKVLQMVYNDLAKKLEFLHSVYPYYNGLYMYDVVYKHFAQPFEYLKEESTKVEYFSDTYEESRKVRDNGLFGEEKRFFTPGEWPIVLIEKDSDKDGRYDWISYTITR